jgi:hypothetical protein
VPSADVLNRLGDAQRSAMWDDITRTDMTPTRRLALSPSVCDRRVGGSKASNPPYSVADWIQGGVPLVTVVLKGDNYAKSYTL